jgi:hypothetical protein
MRGESSQRGTVRNQDGKVIETVRSTPRWGHAGDGVQGHQWTIIASRDQGRYVACFIV